MFTALDENELEVVIDAMDERKIKSGETIIKEGERGDELYVVEDGTLDCFKKFVYYFLFDLLSLARRSSTKACENLRAR